MALEARGRTGLLSTAFSLPSATRSERAKRSDAEDLIGFLGLGRYAEPSLPTCQPVPAHR
ncbi:MAG: hypothetical protein Ct9H300mP12_15640 [Acidimicrobiales bacterium]|nr:MAG: hypothetical protein Ct9H300mP12_15640 [Acidimicrobiales bacterium]